MNVLDRILRLVNVVDQEENRHTRKAMVKELKMLEERLRG